MTFPNAVLKLSARPEGITPYEVKSLGREYGFPGSVSLNIVKVMKKSHILLVREVERDGKKVTGWIIRPRRKSLAGKSKNVKSVDVVPTGKT